MPTRLPVIAVAFHRTGVHNCPVFWSAHMEDGEQLAARAQGQLLLPWSSGSPSFLISSGARVPDINAPLSKLRTLRRP